MNDWHIFRGTTDAGKKSSRARSKPPKPSFPPAPPWRVPGESRAQILAATFRPNPDLIDAVNAAIYLRRPLLITGKPGTGKSSLIFAVARELDLGPVLSWPINSRSILREGLYNYDALARLQRIQELHAKRKPDAPDIIPEPDDLQEMKLFLTLGPLGSALASTTGPRALLVDEIDKSDVDLPNDLLNVLDTGRFEIPELRRLGQVPVTINTADHGSVTITGGEVSFTEFPLVVMTSNGERDFPAPFLRRCVQFDLGEPTPEELAQIVAAHFPQLTTDSELSAEAKRLVGKFVARRAEIALATDQLLNAIHVLHNAERTFTEKDEDVLLKTLFQKLG
jgi:MoxR-like ATPase